MSRPKLISQQQGMVAIVTTMILTIVISLIVVSFSQVVRRNQRQSLDAQLSSQAFYAAESGLNLAREKLSGNTSFTSNNCTDNESDSEYKLDGDNVVISCLMVTPATDITFTDLSTDSRAALLDPVGTGAVNSITVSWKPKNSTPSSGCNSASEKTFPTAWNCNNSLLRMDLIPVDGTFTRDSLIAAQKTVFLRPLEDSSGSNTVTVGALGKGDIVGVKCDPGSCSFQITDLTSQKYAVRVVSLYKPATTVISVDGGKELVGGQAIVDSTGRAQDILKRVQARIPMGTGEDIPEFAADARNTGLCKTYKIIAGASVDVSGNAECNP